MNNEDKIPPLLKEAFLALSISAICNIITQIALKSFLDYSIIVSTILTMLLILFYKRDNEWS